MELVDSILEISMQEPDSSWLSPEYADILKNQDTTRWAGTQTRRMTHRQPNAYTHTRKKRDMEGARRHTHTHTHTLVHRYTDLTLLQCLHHYPSRCNKIQYNTILRSTRTRCLQRWRILTLSKWSGMPWVTMSYVIALFLLRVKSHTAIYQSSVLHGTSS